VASIFAGLSFCAIAAVIASINMAVIITFFIVKRVFVDQIRLFDAEVMLKV
jgi:hypothetical protein